MAELKNGDVLKSTIKYRIEKELGRGAFGIVYLASNEKNIQLIF
jgi:hypothetical protein